MALSAAELVDTRRWAGYPVGGAAPADTLAGILAGLTSQEESVLRSAFLVRLPILEAAIPNTSDTLDTTKAAVWERNQVETAERAILYRSMRMAMCAYLGVTPGPGIEQPAIIVPVPGETPVPATPGVPPPTPTDPLMKDQSIVPAILAL